ncbi:MAG: hypothetical protein HYR85_08050 [Planctomycetes bacterium]|nr:hypothetical protein [Planctomycetota bacterium]MBI3848191.1 hypothetical protein [Planctomycetota bacterium]
MHSSRRLTHRSLDAKSFVGKTSDEIRRIVDSDRTVLVTEDEPIPEGWPRFIRFPPQRSTTHQFEIREGWPRLVPNLIWHVRRLRRAYTVNRGCGSSTFVVWYYHDCMGVLQHVTSSLDQGSDPGFQELPHRTAFVYRRGRTLFRRERVHPIARLTFDDARICTHATSDAVRPELSTGDRFRALVAVVLSGAALVGFAQLMDVRPRAVLWSVIPLVFLHFAFSIAYLRRGDMPFRWLAALISAAASWSVVSLIVRAWS